MGYYSLSGKSVISFPENSRWGSIINFLRKVRNNNLNKTIVIVLDNLRSHKLGEVKAETERLRIELVFLPPCSPDLNPIEYIWKSIKKIVSTTFIRHIDDMRNVIKGASHQLFQKLSFAAGWVNSFLRPYYNYF